MLLSIRKLPFSCLGIDMEDRLKYVLSNVNDWLKFAEAKNAALAATSAAVIIGLFSVIDKKQSLITYLQNYLCISIGLCLLAMICALMSFVPQIRIPVLLRLSNKKKDDNIIFFSDVAKYDPQEYLESLYAASGKPVKEFSSIESFFAEQIIANSRIALRKYRFFSMGISLTGIALAIIFIGLLAFWLLG